MQWVMRSWAILRRVGVQVGPYLMVEILLPGGSLMALLLFLYRRRRAQGAQRSADADHACVREREIPLRDEVCASWHGRMSHDRLPPASVGGWDQPGCFGSRCAIAMTQRLQRVFDAWLDPDSAGRWLFATASRPMTHVGDRRARRRLPSASPMDGTETTFDTAASISRSIDIAASPSPLRLRGTPISSQTSPSRLPRRRMGAH